MAFHHKMTVDPVIATGRTLSMFGGDMSTQSELMSERIRGQRVLAIGAGGSIGSNTVHVLQAFSPACLHVVDQNENALAELVRQLRSQPGGLNIPDFRTLPLDYGAQAMFQFLKSEKPYDLVLNFAAIKHVRSEKDPFSTLQMFDTNILKQDRFLKWLHQTGFSGRYFSVSTDKAANPSSLMGATKRVMEHVMFSRNGRGGADETAITSARFANVAFSNGSLLESFVNRLRRREPLACPKSIKRYFVSLQESGQICALASVLAPDSHIVIPKLDPREHLVLLEDVAIKFIEANGLTPRVYTDETRAIANVEIDCKTMHYPLILTPANTGGEKPYEEFVAKGETAVDIGLQSLGAVTYKPTEGDVAAMMKKLDPLLTNSDSGEVTTQSLKNIIAMLEPDFLDTHVVSALNLDQRA